MSAYWAALAGAIATSMAAQTLLKAGAGVASFLGQLFDLRTMAGLVLYGGAALLYIIALRRIPMSVALPFTAVSYITAALIGYFVFGEAMTPMRVGAIIVICLGVVMLAMS